MANNARLSSAAAWFAYAVEDIKAARTLMGAGQYPIACFHAQQAAEKAFKGLLSATNDVEKGHSVSHLAKTIHELQYDASEPLPPVGKLDRFYIATRYPLWENWTGFISQRDTLMRCRDLPQWMCLTLMTPRTQSG